MELKMSKREFIREMESTAFRLITDTNISDDKTTALHAFINVMVGVLERNASKDCGMMCTPEASCLPKSDFAKSINKVAADGATGEAAGKNNNDSLKPLLDVIKHLQVPGVDVEVHVLDLSDNKRD